MKIRKNENGEMEFYDWKRKEWIFIDEKGVKILMEGDSGYSATMILKVTKE